MRSWSSNEARQRPDLLRIGYFGSYARGDWGVGSDLDLIAVVTDISIPFEERFVEWDLTDLPVPAEIPRRLQICPNPQMSEKKCHIPISSFFPPGSCSIM